MKYLVALIAVLPCVLCVPWVEMTQSKNLMTDIDVGSPLETVFQNFRQIHGKKYESATEEVYRKEIFKVNVQKIKDHNEQYARGEKSYYLGVNQFTDLTHKEFLALYTGHLHKRNPHRNASTYLVPNNVKCPENVDWRKEGYVTEVKNQGQCGSCWSFSATGSLEGQNFRKKGVLTSLSEQQLIDCSGKYGNQGCNGGLMDQAFEYIEAIGGIDSEADYPYLAEVEDKCEYNPKKEKAEVTGYVDVESGSEKMLKKAVCTEGPISVAIDASHSSFQLYSGGVYDEPECSSEQLDHGVLVVGYGKDDEGIDYWLIKNSWGTSWGEEGYVKMVRNKDNQCGVASQASYPKV